MHKQQQVYVSGVNKKAAAFSELVHKDCDEYIRQSIVPSF